MKRQVIISGAGSGIGRAMALRLAAQGYACILLGRDTTKLQTTLEKLTGNGHRVLTADIRKREILQDLAQSLQSQPVFALIANAGIGGENHYGDQDRWDEIITTNLSGTYEFIRAFQPLLGNDPAAPRHILINSSVLARLGVKNYTAYCASKAGLLGLMRSLAVELAPDNILVNAICPGWVETEMSQAGMEGIARGLGIDVEAFREIAMQDVPLKRMSQPDEVAALVEYLLSQRSITGQVIDINNGSVMNS
jgi:NAD(P)-dependent dehydrogenase (short-subunit alcohol dehydrogenase family)